MKKLIPFIILLALCIRMQAQTTPAEAQKIATFTKIWGFLKYYHPTVATGKLDWDHEYMTRLKDLAALNTRDEISNYYSNWIGTLGFVTPCSTCSQNKDSITRNLDLDWLSDGTLFNARLMDELQYIRQNRNQGKNYYVQFYPVGNTGYRNEKPYKDSVYPGAEMRLLSLARYWNIIEYFYPYKYGIGEDWNHVLVEMIPLFRDAPDTMAYHLAMMQLVASIRDSHADLINHYTNLHFGLKWAPFDFKLIDNQAIVTRFYNDSLCAKNDIRYGDVFLSVNGKDIAGIIREQWKYVGSSNDAVKLRNMYCAIFNGNTDSVEVTYERDGVVGKKTLYRYYFKYFYPKGYKPVRPEACKILPGNIAYVNMAGLSPGQVPAIIKQVKDTRAIIFDVRNYPNGAMFKLAALLDTAPVPFARISMPDVNYPGMFRYNHFGPMYCGLKKNKHAYKGRVILLFNEMTQSHAEFTLMALQTAPRVTGIGSTTAGADGNVSDLVFPGNYHTYMTGLGVYYPDGRETQRVGIFPDIVVHPTIAGIRAHRDEVLDKALEVIGKD